MSFLKNIIGSTAEEELQYDKDNAILVDVRTPEEFSHGHLEQSINIPLGAIQNHISDFKFTEKPIVLICRSGARSGRASHLLRSHGIDAYNGGAWNSYNS